MTITPGKKREKIDRLAELSAVRDDERGVSLWQEAFRRLRRNPAAIVGAVILAIFVLVAVVGPFFVPYGPTDSIGIREGVV
jgi:peptide/nickel transport system permease protein